MDTITLVLPVGGDTGPISHGTATFRPYLEDPDDPASRLLVKVPREVAERMVGVGGFQMADQDLPPAAADERAKAPFVRMYHPDHGTCDRYQVDKQGFLHVPNGPDIALMRSHGFLVEGEEPALEPVEETVPVSEQEAALARIKEFEQKLKMHEIDAKHTRDALDIAEGKVNDLTKELAVALAALKSKGVSDQSTAPAPGTQSADAAETAPNAAADQGAPGDAPKTKAAKVAGNPA